MKVFVSWSGPDTKALAESIKLWLPKILLGKVELFVSSQDIAKGERGLSVIAESLDAIDYGLVILTKANQEAKWINFEAGALGKSLGKALVSPLLVDLTESDVSGPLAQFQMTTLTDRDDVWKLVCDINKALPEPFPEDGLQVLFDSAWPGFEKAVAKARKGSEPTKTSRPAEDILDEILLRIRRLEQRDRVRPTRRDSGLTMDQEKDLVSQVFVFIQGAKSGETRAGVRMTSQGLLATVSTPADSEVDIEGLQAVADNNDMKIEVNEDQVVIEPKGRYRDPGVTVMRLKE